MKAVHLTCLCFCLITVALAGCGSRDSTSINTSINTSIDTTIKQRADSIISFKTALPKDYSYAYSSPSKDGLTNAVIDNESKDLQVQLLSVKDFDSSTSLDTLPIAFKVPFQSKPAKSKEEIIGGRKVLIADVGQDSETPAKIAKILFTGKDKHADFLLIRPLHGDKLDEETAVDFLSDIKAFL
jgi:hypothetical protein